jgi:prepilin-type N-terminal cleavage/methylation domain-containing protein
MNKFHKVSNSKKQNSKPGGFTIIEIIIALSVASLILVIVFIAIPTAQKSVRDNHRKAYAGLVLDQVLKFSSLNKRLPACLDPNTSPSQCPNANPDAINFITHYMPEGSDPLTGDSFRSDSAGPITTSFCNGTGISSQKTMYCWDDTISFWMRHDLTLTPGQIILAAGHICNDGSSTITGRGAYDPLTIADPDSSFGQANGFGDVAIVIGMERGGYFCVTNGKNR